MRALLCAAVVAGSLACWHRAGGAAEPVIFYVATDGNDAWSGRLPAPNAEKTDGPFATLTRARDAIRGLKTAGALAAPVTVQIREGTYYLTEPVVLGPQDSGTKEAPIAYTAYPNEKPVLCGGRTITGWKPEQDGMYSVVLPDVKEGRWYFRQLFADGERQVRARCPNFDPADPYRKGFLYVGRGAGGFGVSVGNIHNPGDWMEYKIQAPADGEYRFWIYYGALNKPHGNTDMGGRTVLIVDGGSAPMPLMNLPDTGDWRVFRWSCAAAVHLTKGPHTLRWQNIKGGGLNIEAFALSNDADWKPVDTRLPEPVPGTHAIVIQAEDYVACRGKQLSLSGGQGSKTEFCYKPGDFKPSWAKVPDAELHIFQSGSCRAFKEIVSIKGVDEQTRTVSLSGSECVASLQTGDRYFVENVFEELDAPGEWHLDRETGRLCYRPKEAFSQKTRVVAPVVDRVFLFEADTETKQGVNHVRIAGLTIETTDYQSGDGCEGYGMGREGVVHLVNAAYCAVENCTFRNIGRYAVCLAGGEGNRIEGNDIERGAQGGILLLGSARNIVSDNHIRHCGWVYKHIGGVILQGKGADENVVSHNLIHDMTRYGISLKNAGGRNIIEYNRVGNTNTETYDTGGIEVTQHDKEFRSGSIIRNNIVADTIGYSSNDEKPVFLSWGIYLDSFAGGYEVVNNIVYRNHNGGIMLQGGKDNRVTNNIFVDGVACQGYISNFARNSTGQVLERNIFYYTNPDAVLFAAGALTQDVIRVDHNLYFNASGEVRTGWGGKMSLDEWRKQGFDAHSLVADPRFVDPKSDNYALRPDSPAFTLGFKAIDTGQVGLKRPRP